MEVYLHHLIAMPPRATIVEEFDDDTDLPLPSRALPNTGTRGALLEEITSDSDDDDDMEIPQLPTMQPVAPSARSRHDSVPSHIPPGATVTTDASQFKECVWRSIGKHDIDI
jgi:signal recognition particle subunit SRP19